MKVGEPGYGGPPHAPGPSKNCTDRERNDLARMQNWRLMELPDVLALITPMIVVPYIIACQSKGATVFSQP